MKDLFAPLRDIDRYTATSVLGGLTLLVIYLYQGNHTFFMAHLGGHLVGTPYAALFAQGYQFIAALITMAILPALGVAIAPKEQLREHGVTLGDVRFGLKTVALAVLILAPILYINAGAADFQAEYPLAKVAGCSVKTFILWELSYLLYYIGWEFFFRGLWQLGLGRHLGVGPAMALQTAVSTVMHIGKPQGETFSAIVAGPAFGLITLRTRSILYVLLIHWYVGMSTDLYTLLRSTAPAFGGCP